MTLLLLVALAGFQSYVAFTPQGIVQNRFFAVTDHLTTYDNLVRVDIRCQPTTYRPKGESQMHTKLRITIGAHTKSDGYVNIITKTDAEEVDVGPSRNFPPQLTPQVVRDMHQLLNSHHILVAPTPCPDIDIYEPQMTPAQRDYYWALFSGGGNSR